MVIPATVKRCGIAETGRRPKCVRRGRRAGHGGDGFRDSDGLSAGDHCLADRQRNSTSRGAKRQRVVRDAAALENAGGPTEILGFIDRGPFWPTRVVGLRILSQGGGALPPTDPGERCVCRLALSEQFGDPGQPNLEARKLAVLPHSAVAACRGANHGHRCMPAESGRNAALALSARYPAPEAFMGECGTSAARTILPTLRQLRGAVHLRGKDHGVGLFGDKTSARTHPFLPQPGAGALYGRGFWVGKFLKTCTYPGWNPGASVETRRLRGPERQWRASRNMLGRTHHGACPRGGTATAVRRGSPGPGALDWPIGNPSFWRWF